MNVKWINHPNLKNMDPIKLELIKTASSQTSDKKGNDLAPILFSLITNARKKSIRFTPDEFTLILEILKEGKSEKERKQIDKTVNMVRSMLKL